ncbi:membrane-spanning 4-domains subfamily A member 8-like [Acipenser ruthenus]|uniref:membrane-spanning 4-domains subfamily A member 8-like n=1 Tax=Acipenser ruthenus TaxID=7906 RepID=UPI002740F391|nr:membrane-spanning 4-domains subfamily A member 8-like [Acipenser ruthenus]XP_058863783.1 membrane-spanning 4-domains subfamily A member 8-like [Acipenser ruthenus]XP_058863784.1 membrane-spanning 4-domains subfamily A member 8-like [Acipenser ruthenus]XP_058863785.1 membrane-spanning 4-domains subfamily A member 8-like [Acipenser ruthenus]XP_058863786.1 membrane-spanning 4-domains subfamily A member 8-like [Acipenser ruthenus]XP_058863787.1 membrane-spanning 4-domains subfamily A member 8-l
MSTSVGGVVVVTQFYPQAPPDNGPPAPAGVPRCQVVPSSTLCQPSGQLKRFLKGEPRPLGTVQIIMGVINILFGAVLSRTLWSIAGILGAPFWTGLFYIISGSLSVAADKTPKISLIKGTLAMNILSSIVAGVGIIIYLVDLAVCSRYNSYAYHSYDSDTASPVLLNRTAEGLKSVLLVFTTLEFCVAVSLSGFGCKSVCHGSQDQTPLVVIQSAYNTARAPPAGAENIYSLAAPPYNPIYTPQPVALNPPPYKS